jgi:hypothetical protein
MSAGIKVGLVGARGYVGAELIRLLSVHPRFELAFVSSRELDGQCVSGHIDRYRGDLRYSSPAHEELPRLGADAVVLALPNGKAEPCVAAFDAQGIDPVIVDLSADYRFDNAWYYGLPELTRAALRRPAPHQQSRLLRHGDATGDRADARCARRAGAVFRCVGLLRRRHHAFGQERSQRNCVTT